jgi:WhiB family redox-sensing transcriptional regulator
MFLKSSSPQQVKVWRELAEAADEIGSNLPCRQAPELFFAGPGELHLTNMAKRACKTCPLINECLAYAVEFNEVDGVWGGTTPSERKRMRKRR